MFDFKSHFNIVKSVAQQVAKEIHKPSLSNKESMVAYAKAVGATGKASFMPEKHNGVIEYV